MARPQIGHDYRLDIKNDLHDEPIAWVNNSSKKLFDTWGEINGNIVKVKAETMIMSTYYIVTLLQHPKDTFYVPKKLLMELTRRLAIPCQCVLQNLINRGCKCGAFKKEQATKSK
jgi:hypothetical protein